MKKTLKWVVICALLAALLCCGAAMAETDTDGNITWTLSEDGLLTISGSGAMPDYSSTYVDGAQITTAPWGTSVTSVVIEEGVTSIGNYAFSGCTNLTGVTIPASVTTMHCGESRALTVYLFPDDHRPSPGAAATRPL